MSDTEDKENDVPDGTVAVAKTIYRVKAKIIRANGDIEELEGWAPSTPPSEKH